MTLLTIALGNLHTEESSIWRKVTGLRRIWRYSAYHGVDKGMLVLSWARSRSCILGLGRTWVRPASKAAPNCSRPKGGRPDELGLRSVPVLLKTSLSQSPLPPPPRSPLLSQGPLSDRAFTVIDETLLLPPFPLTKACALSSASFTPRRLKSIYLVARSFP